MEVRNYGQRQIIDDYMTRLEEQDRLIEKSTLLRVIKNRS
jgi:hypothetical protein